jgi:hypothetical protein
VITHATYLTRVGGALRLRSHGSRRPLADCMAQAPELRFTSVAVQRGQPALEGGDLYARQGRGPRGERGTLPGPLGDGSGSVESSAAMVRTSAHAWLSAVISAQRARLAEADERVAAARALAERQALGEHWFTVMIDYATGELARARGDLQGARAQVERGLSIARRCGLRLDTAYGLLALSRIGLAAGAEAEARELRARAQRQLTACPDPGFLRGRCRADGRRAGACALDVGPRPSRGPPPRAQPSARIGLPPVDHPGERARLGDGRSPSPRSRCLRGCGSTTANSRRRLGSGAPTDRARAHQIKEPSSPDSSNGGEARPWA